MSEFGLAGDAGGKGAAIEMAAREAAQAPSMRKAQGRKGAVKVFWAAGGFVSFGLGVIGAVLPIIPTTPFLLAAAFFFARSSDRLDAWFKSTKLYKRVLEGYATKRSMTVKAKLTILVPVTVLLSIGFALMTNVPIGRIVLAIVWIGHIAYFGFVVKTDRSK